MSHSMEALTLLILTYVLLNLQKLGSGDRNRSMEHSRVDMGQSNHQHEDREPH
jgi:hypothetical protein